jgi:hypothetical protein
MTDERVIGSAPEIEGIKNVPSLALALFPRPELLVAGDLMAGVGWLRRRDGRQGAKRRGSRQGFDRGTINTIRAHPALSIFAVVRGWRECSILLRHDARLGSTLLEFGRLASARLSQRPIISLGPGRSPSSFAILTWRACSILLGRDARFDLHNATKGTP